MASGLFLGLPGGWRGQARTCFCTARGLASPQIIPELLPEAGCWSSLYYWAGNREPSTALGAWELTAWSPCALTGHRKCSWGPHQADWSLQPLEEPCIHPVGFQPWTLLG